MPPGDASPAAPRPSRRPAGRAPGIPRESGAGGRRDRVTSSVRHPSMRSLPHDPTYDTIGEGYDRTRTADPFITDRLAHHLALRADGEYLDVACGSGNYTGALAGRGGRWVGVDHSRHMLELARRKDGEVAWQAGDVEALPLEDGRFHGACISLAIHHFASLPRALAEVRRVLAPGARLVIFTSTAEQMAGYWLREYWPVAVRRSIEQMPTMAAIEAALAAAGLELVGTEPYFVRPDLEDGFLYQGKHRPARYLDPEVRRGASTFASLADADEIRDGCERLQEDLRSGRIEEVRAAYEHVVTQPPGDYLFVVACVPS
jgi:ubiquinone/menaquinone biosynthesis C-methylase UbiE